MPGSLGPAKVISTRGVCQPGVRVLMRVLIVPAGPFRIIQILRKWRLTCGNWSSSDQAGRAAGAWGPRDWSPGTLGPRQENRFSGLWARYGESAEGFGRDEMKAITLAREGSWGLDSSAQRRRSEPSGAAALLWDSVVAEGDRPAGLRCWPGASSVTGRP